MLPTKKLMNKRKIGLRAKPFGRGNNIYTPLFLWCSHYDCTEFEWTASVSYVVNIKPSAFDYSCIIMNLFTAAVVYCPLRKNKV